jgi:hypothetical protein
LELNVNILVFFAIFALQAAHADVVLLEILTVLPEEVSILLKL